MSELSPAAARLLRDARDLLGPEPEALSRMSDALDAQLEAGAALSCGAIDEQAALDACKPRARAARWFGAGKFVVAAGLALLGGAAWIALQSPATPRAEPPPPRAALSVPEAAVSEASPALAPRPFDDTPRVAHERTSERRTEAARSQSTPLLARGVSSHVRTAEPRQPNLAIAPAAISVNKPLSTPPAVHERVLSTTQERSDRAEPARDPLVREVALIEGARAALDRGDHTRALTILNAHAREYPGGALAEEQLALRAQLLCGLGRVADSRAAMQRLAARNPSSPHLQRESAACRDAN